ncbi:apolipoprotein N-acyltransferase [Pseudaquabacterium pictum]|uniref:Apolipoprotein N-acyltransferase n=1 Tax=Pseudaquabacterium pictum TaxID=2315236 RepID=A0A480AX59_9BURK|nr:apolipoprotein N-acyltransferase [Rubrivivax pictus]GCL66064.1 apolipoprotein N-acyltransferase [Rubrivivax pictus]
MTGSATLAARHPWLVLAAVAAAGALQTLACVHTAAWPLPLAAIALLAWAVQQATPRQAALLGWAFGTAWLGAATWWLFISMHRYGGLPAPLAVAAVALLSAALSVYLGAAMAWVAHRRSGRPLADASRFAAGWLAAELARGVLFTGFPWAASGYTQVDGPLAVLAPWLGVYGIGALLAWVGALLVSGLWQGPAARWRPAALALAVLALPAAWGIVLGPPEFTRPGRSLNVALLQTNVAQDEKFAAERMPATLAWVAHALTSAQADLVVTPETAVPLLPDQLQDLVPGYWDGLRQHFSRPGGPAALVGVPLGNFEAGYTNSVVGLSADTAAPGGGYRYDKTHLVPFGEFIPTGFRWFTELMNIPLGDFNRGPLNPPSFVVGGARVAPNICYEDLFGEELARRFADAASAPTVLANISNIGWFGDTIAIPQHLNISRLRSLELQRPMLRATNTGATAVIDHRGVVQAALPPFTVGVLNATVQGREGLTPFARWAAAAGLWPLWALAALGLAWPRRQGAAGKLVDRP